MQETGTQGAGTAPGIAVAQGFTLLQQGKLAEATQHCRALVLAHPADPQVMMLACEVRLANGDLAGASEAADAALAGMPGNAAVMLKKAHVLVLQRERAEARRLASEAAALAPADGRSQWAAGKIFANCGDAAAASPSYEAAIAAGMTHWALNFDLASAQFFAGQFDGADRNLARVLAHVPGHGQAMYLRSVLRRQTRDHNHVADLQARPARTARGVDDRIDWQQLALAGVDVSGFTWAWLHSADRTLLERRISAIRRLVLARYDELTPEHPGEWALSLSMAADAGHFDELRGEGAHGLAPAWADFFERFDMEKYGSDGAPLHDPCVIAYLIRPDLFKGRHINVQIETQSELTRGMTVADWWGVTGRPANALFVGSVDADGFYALLTERLARL